LAPCGSGDEKGPARVPRSWNAMVPLKAQPVCGPSPHMLGTLGPAWRRFDHWTIPEYRGGGREGRHDQRRSSPVVWS
jgi:hypothetical protein